MRTKSVAEKLLLERGGTLWLFDGSYLDLAGPLPDGAGVVGEPGNAATAVVFADSAASLRDALTSYGEQLARPTAFWVAYPKANRADINRDTLWPILAEYGMRPIGQVALDNVWSALRFRPLRDGEAPFTGGR